MATYSGNPYTVTLLYWPNAPAPSDSGRSRIFRSGHIALEVKKNGVTVDYLGWWPRSYSVQRSRTPRGYLQKLLDRLSLWFTRVDGWLSSYGIVQDAQKAQEGSLNEQIGPDTIDSVLVGNIPLAKMPHQGATLEDWTACETLPEHVCIAMSERNAEKVRAFIQNFRNNARNNQIKYQFFSNNCATAVAQALKCGGHPIPPSILWWPSRLMAPKA